MRCETISSVQASGVNLNLPFVNQKRNANILPQQRSRSSLANAYDGTNIADHVYWRESDGLGCLLHIVEKEENVSLINFSQSRMRRTVLEIFRVV